MLLIKFVQILSLRVFPSDHKNIKVYLQATNAFLYRRNEWKKERCFSYLMSILYPIDRKN